MVQQKSKVRVQTEHDICLANPFSSVGEELEGKESESSSKFVFKELKI